MSSLSGGLLHREPELWIPNKIRYFGISEIPAVLPGTEIPNTISVPIPIPNGWHRITFYGDTEWHRSVKFPLRQRIFIIYILHICPIGASDTILTMHDKCCLCRLEIAVNCCVTRSFCLHFHHWRIDPSNSGNTEHGTPSAKRQTQGSSSKRMQVLTR